ncbi:MAG TPA: transglycosylase domain-containing protein [Mycobacteriales bacterium]|nr:transglycosylase domain-containing protein [Mycobacteriales bacterium]
MSPATRAAAVRGWRQFLPRPKQMLIGVLAASLASVVLIGIGYATTSIPNASEFATAQATRLYYSDGRTPLAKLGDISRVDVDLDRVPVAVQHAVLAAEDRHFYEEPGISPTGILRALWTDLRGGEISQGGSTITQQYVKNAYLTSDRTFTRKFKEIFISTKLANSRSKQEILRDYLNTIYFGRGAYGIQAAAQAYFRKDVQDLNAAEGAVLAATISQPSFYDPAVNKEAAQQRWRYVIDGMVSQRWLDADRARSMDYPRVKSPPRKSGSGCVGDVGFICQAVRLELDKLGFDRDRLSAGGYRVITTIDKPAQQAAEAAINDNGGTFQTGGVDRGREAALVSVQPGDGAIRAMYGGSQYCAGKKRPDLCTDLTGVSGHFGGGDYTRPPGSSFKPYTVIAALKEGIGLESTYHGPPSIEINGDRIQNSEGESCGTCTLLQALAESINTIFVPLADQVGPDKVVDAAYDAGIPKKRDLGEFPGVTLGPDDVSPLDQAVGYATIAAQGVRAEPYLVAKIANRDGNIVYRAKPKTERVFPADVMADTTYAMTKVLDCSEGGTACGHALSGRPAAGKTGTNGHEEGNFDAWFIGFTPQLSTAVWYGNANRNKPVTAGGAQLYGGMLPASTWQQMMNAALAGAPVRTFPPPAHVGSNEGSASPLPSETTSSPAPTKTQGTGSPAPTSASPSGILDSPSPSPSPSPTSTGQATPATEPSPSP